MEQRIGKQTNDGSDNAWQMTPASSNSACNAFCNGNAMGGKDPLGAIWWYDGTAGNIARGQGMGAMWGLKGTGTGNKRI